MNPNPVNSSILIDIQHIHLENWCYDYIYIEAGMVLGSYIDVFWLSNSLTTGLFLMTFDWLVRYLL